jgi:uncharacterized membrane protein YhdT
VLVFSDNNGDVDDLWPFKKGPSRTQCRLLPLLFLLVVYFIKVFFLDVSILDGLNSWGS